MSILRRLPPPDRFSVVERAWAGGMIVFDDYRWENCPGVAKAIERAGLQVVQSAHNQCYWTAP